MLETATKTKICVKSHCKLSSCWNAMTQKMSNKAVDTYPSTTKLVI